MEDKKSKYIKVWDNDKKKYILKKRIVKKPMNDFQRIALEQKIEHSKKRGKGRAL